MLQKSMPEVLPELLFYFSWIRFFSQLSPENFKIQLMNLYFNNVLGIILLKIHIELSLEWH
jgi:hypothetical protein